MKNLRSLAQKLRYFPKNIKGVSVEASKAHAVGVKDTIKTGLLQMNLVTPPLKPSTLEIKKRQGKPRIKTPLVGWGLQRIDSMINGLKVIKRNGKYRLSPDGTHYSGKRQALIWSVHEYGAIITNAFGKGITVRIPPRFPLRKGVQRYLRSQAKNTTNKELAKFLKAVILDNKQEISYLQDKWEKKE
jgi:hypothetical protein